MGIKTIDIITFKNLKRFPELIHGLSTRKGGISTAPFDALNLGLSTPDDQNNVHINRNIFFKQVGISEKRLVIPQQVHSDHAEVVLNPGIVSQTDALITNQKNLFLSVQTADCFPILIFDPVFLVLGIVHSGWRGTAGNIAVKTVRKMHTIFGCSPGTLVIAIGAGVQGACYQVDDKTASHFDQKFLTPDGPGHFKLDVQKAIAAQLLAEGIKPGQIEMDETCTHCASDLYYSYRRDGNQSGRMMAVIGLQS